jgi:hypothetical protein
MRGLGINIIRYYCTAQQHWLLFVLWIVVVLAGTDVTAVALELWLTSIWGGFRGPAGGASLLDTPLGYSLAIRGFNTASVIEAAVFEILALLLLFTCAASLSTSSFTGVISYCS